MATKNVAKKSEHVQALALVEGELRIDSRAISVATDTKHPSTYRYIRENEAIFSSLGSVIALQARAGGRTGQREYFCMLNKKQAALLICSQRTTKRNLELKRLIAGDMFSLEHIDFGRNEPATPRYIYFIKSGGLIKIGSTKSINARVRQIRGMSPSKTELLGFLQSGEHSEASIHRKFQHCRVRNEWFTPSEEICEFISRLCAKPREQRAITG